MPGIDASLDAWLGDLSLRQYAAVLFLTVTVIVLIVDSLLSIVLNTAWSPMDAVSQAVIWGVIFTVAYYAFRTRELRHAD